MGGVSEILQEQRYFPLAKLIRLIGHIFWGGGGIGIEGARGKEKGTQGQGASQ